MILTLSAQSSLFLPQCQQRGDLCDISEGFGRVSKDHGSNVAIGGIVNSKTTGQVRSRMFPPLAAVSVRRLRDHGPPLPLSGRAATPRCFLGPMRLISYRALSVVLTCH